MKKDILNEVSRIQNLMGVTLITENVIGTAIRRLPTSVKTRLFSATDETLDIMKNILKLDSEGAKLIKGAEKAAANGLEYSDDVINFFVRKGTMDDLVELILKSDVLSSTIKNMTDSTVTSLRNVSKEVSDDALKALEDTYRENIESLGWFDDEVVDAMVKRHRSELDNAAKEVNRRIGASAGKLGKEFTIDDMYEGFLQEWPRTHRELKRLFVDNGLYSRGSGLESLFKSTENADALKSILDPKVFRDLKAKYPNPKEAIEYLIEIFNTYSVDDLVKMSQSHRNIGRSISKTNLTKIIGSMNNKQRLGWFLALTKGSSLAGLAITLFAFLGVAIKYGEVGLDWLMDWLMSGAEDLDKQMAGEILKLTQSNVKEHLIDKYVIDEPTFDEKYYITINDSQDAALVDGPVGLASYDVKLSNGKITSSEI